MGERIVLPQPGQVESPELALRGPVFPEARPSLASHPLGRVHEVDTEGIWGFVSALMQEPKLLCGKENFLFIDSIVF